MRIKCHSYQVPLHPAVRRCVTPAALRCTSYKTKRPGNPHQEEYYDQKKKERGNKAESVGIGKKRGGCCKTETIKSRWLCRISKPISWHYWRWIQQQQEQCFYTGKGSIIDGIEYYVPYVRFIDHLCLPGIYLSFYIDFISLVIWIHKMTKLFKMPTNHRVSNKSKESES